MDAIECIATRRSIRHFLDIPVDQETILTIVEAGSFAPSSGNLQDWKFIVIDEKPIMKTLAEYCVGQAPVQNAAFLVVVCADSEQTERLYGLRGDRLYTIQNCAAATQNMLLAAHALGLGGTWIGAFDENKIRTLLNIPQKIRPQVVLTFGYPSDIPAGKNLKDLAVITFFNSYGSKVKNIHRVLRDYHVDWEKRISSASTSLEKLKVKAVESASDAAAKAKESGQGFWAKLGFGSKKK